MLTNNSQILLILISNTSLTSLHSWVIPNTAIEQEKKEDKGQEPGKEDATTL